MSLAIVSSRGFGEKQETQPRAWGFGFLLLQQLQENLGAGKATLPGRKGCSSREHSEIYQRTKQISLHGQKTRRNFTKMKNFSISIQSRFSHQNEAASEAYSPVLILSLPSKPSSSLQKSQLLMEKCLRVSELLLRLSARKEPDVIRFKLITQGPNLH